MRAFFMTLLLVGFACDSLGRLLYSTIGSRILSVILIESAPDAQCGLHASASLDEKTGDVILKVVNSVEAAKPVRVTFGDAAAAFG
jgi:hypothetical protein